MNSIQLAIVVAVILMIIIIVGYYWYQEAKFRRMVETNFNQRTDDVITKDKPFILDGDNNSNGTLKTKPVLQKDISELDLDLEPDDKHMNNAHLADPEANIPEDSMEAFFAKIEQIPFPYTDSIDITLDYVANIAFEEPSKIKILPELSQFTAKKIRIYILTKDNQWQIFERGNKYIANALKIVIELVDKDGVVSQAQIANMYNELYKFVLQHNAHIQQSDYEKSLFEINRQLKHVKGVKLDLELFLICKAKVSFDKLSSFFTSHGLSSQDGIFRYMNDGVELFCVSNETGNPFQSGTDYDLFLIKSSLHLVNNPREAADAIFDFTEKFMREFESRLLTANKQVFAQRDYDILNKYLGNYIANAEKNSINLGGKLLFRVLPTT